MTNSILYRVGLPTFVGVSIIGLWQLMSFVGAINPIMIPSPWDIGVAFSELVPHGLPCRKRFTVSQLASRSGW